jgi:hypothetical protein
MNPNFLDFEQPIAELEAKIQELRHASQGQAFNIEEDIGRLRDKLKHKTAEIFRNLAWQSRSSRAINGHTHRLPRRFAANPELPATAVLGDAAIVGGLARIDGRSVVVVGHQKAATRRPRSALSACAAPGATAGVAPDEWPSAGCGPTTIDTPGAYRVSAPRSAARRSDRATSWRCRSCVPIICW